MIDDLKRFGLVFFFFLVFIIGTVTNFIFIYL